MVSLPSSEQGMSFLTELQAHFASNASEYDDQTQWRRNPDLLETIKEFAGDISKKVVLDVGTGTGIVANHLAVGPSLIVGADLSHEMLEVAHKKGINVVECNVEDLPFGDGTIDLCTIRQILHYVDDTRVISEAVRTLKCGGMIIMADSVVASTSDVEWWNLLKRTVQPLRRRVYHPGSHVALLEQHNVTIINQKSQVIRRFDGWEIFFRQVPDDINRRSIVAMLVKAASGDGVSSKIELSEEGIGYDQFWITTLAARNPD